MKKVNDTRIYKSKYYPMYYNDKLKLNLVPISYYSREQAIYTLERQFGKKSLKTLMIIKGSKAIERKLELGKNVFMGEQVKKYYIPPEYNLSKSRRRTFIKGLRRVNKTNQPSGVKKLVDKYFYKTHGTTI